MKNEPHGAKLTKRQQRATLQTETAVRAIKRRVLTCEYLEASVRARLRRLGSDVTVEVRPLAGDPTKTIGLSIFRGGVLVQWLSGKLGELEREARLLVATRDGGVRWTGGE